MGRSPLKKTQKNESNSEILHTTKPGMSGQGVQFVSATSFNYRSTAFEFRISYVLEVPAAVV